MNLLSETDSKATSDSMTDGHIDVLVTGDTLTGLIKFQPASEDGRTHLKKHYGARLDKQGALLVYDSESELVFDLIDENGIWTETRG